MNDTQHDMSFSGLFGSAWNAFKSNYGLCLGLGILVFILIFCIQIVTLTLATSQSNQENLYTSAVVAVTSEFVLMVVIGSPLGALIVFQLVKRLRGHGSTRSGWYSRVLLVSFVAQLIMLPASICLQFGNPGQYEINKLFPEKITALFQMASEKQDSADTEGPAAKRYKEIVAEEDALYAKGSYSLQLLGILLMIVAVLINIVWAPWAGMAACDSDESTEGGVETIKRGRELAVGASGSIIGTFVVLMIILVASFFACFFPGIFFGGPLYLAWTPAVYLLLSAGSHSAAPEAA